MFYAEYSVILTTLFVIYMQKLCEQTKFMNLIANSNLEHV